MPKFSTEMKSEGQARRDGMVSPAPQAGPSDPDILTVQEAARILRCRVDTLRRVPRDQLPVYRGPGRSNLYLREDLRQYVRSRRILPAVSDELRREVLD